MNVGVKPKRISQRLHNTLLFYSPLHFCSQRTLYNLIKLKQFLNQLLTAVIFRNIHITY